MNSTSYNVIGVMSGTSLDGLDIAYCNFIYSNKKWKYKITLGSTYEYSNNQITKFSSVHNLNGLELTKLHKEYGAFIGEKINHFIKSNSLTPDFISSHGHTVFHQPDKGITLQIGDGSVIAATTGINTICDFRSLDVALGGQGAPLVPIGDELLFAEYAYCLNFGGFANISFRRDNKRIAFDICPVNMTLNYLTGKDGNPFDDKGKAASTGKIDTKLLNKLNKLDFYKELPPKSLGKEWHDQYIIPIIESSSLSNNDKLRTFCEHIAIQVASVINSDKDEKLLITGGGAYNDFLISLIKNHNGSEIVIPENKVINFKEALIFAFLGVLRFRNEINSLASVTGAKSDNIGGCIYTIL